MSTIRESRSASGTEYPFSHLEIVCLVTLRRAARSSCVYPLFLRIVLMYCDIQYIFAVFTSQYFVVNMKESAGGTATPIINRGIWDTLLIPLPPLAEQKHIVAKLEEILPLCERMK